MTAELKPGILGKYTSLACAGGPLQLALSFSDRDIVDDPQCPAGYVKRMCQLSGEQICHAAGVQHAGALRVTGLDICDHNMPLGMIGIKEITPCGSGRAFPSATRTTLRGTGLVAGMHVTGRSGAPVSHITLENSLVPSIPGCCYETPTITDEIMHKINHLTCKWPTRIGTHPDDISWSCIHSTDNDGNPIIGIPLSGTDVCCMSQFASDLYKDKKMAKVYMCFGDSPITDAVKTPAGVPMLRITGDEGTRRFNAAKAQLAANMAPAWGHHGFEFAYYSPQGSVLSPHNCCNVNFNRCLGGLEGARTVASCAKDSNIIIPAVLSTDSTELLVQQLKDFAVIDNDEASARAAQQVTTAVPLLQDE